MSSHKISKTNSLPKSIAKTLRPRMVLIPWIIYSSTLFILGQESVYLMFFGLVLYISIYGIVAILNDLSDKIIDQVNNRDIPIANSQLSLSNINKILYALVILLLISCIFLGWVSSLVAITYIIIGWVYSKGPALKNKSWYGVAVLSVAYGVLPWVLGALLSGQIPNELIFIMIASFVFSVGTIPLKDYKDYKGDKQFGKNTVLVTRGNKTVKKSMLICIFTAGAILSVGLFVFSRQFILPFVIFSIYILYILAIKNKNLKNTSQRISVARYSRLLFYSSAISTLSYLQ